MLPVLLIGASVAVSLDIDSVRQPELAASGRLDLRFRCLQSHIEPAIHEAYTTNYTGLGWSAALVQPLISNLTGCLDLSMSELYGVSSLFTPLTIALTATCAYTSDPSRPWEPARSLSPLRTLDFEGSLLEADGAAALEPIIQACPSVEVIHLPNNSLSDVGARAIASALFSPPHAGCRRLDLNDNLIGDYGADGLARLMIA